MLLALAHMERRAFTCRLHQRLHQRQQLRLERERRRVDRIEPRHFRTQSVAAIGRTQHQACMVWSSDASRRSTVLLYSCVRSASCASDSTLSPAWNAASRLSARSTAAAPPGAASRSATDTCADFRGMAWIPQKQWWTGVRIDTRPDARLKFFSTELNSILQNIVKYAPT